MDLVDFTPNNTNDEVLTVINKVLNKQNLILEKLDGFIQVMIEYISSKEDKTENKTENKIEEKTEEKIEDKIENKKPETKKFSNNIKSINSNKIIIKRN